MEVSEEVFLKAARRFSAERGKGTLPNLLVFGRILREAGLRVTLSQVMDAGRALDYVDISSKEDFRAALRSNLVSDKGDLALFDRAFDFFWRDFVEVVPSESFAVGAYESREEAQRGGEELGPEDGVGEISEGDSTGADAESLRMATYSPSEVLAEKDFSEMGIEESRAIRQAILLIANKIATQISRRKRRSRRGEEIDPRWSMRRSIRYGGDLIELVWRRRRIKKVRVVLLCDVSGSMDCYSRFLIQFMYGLQNELWGVETFVFSTSLSRITHLIRTRDIVSALERISHSVLGWSGGTNIGRSLYTFNREFAPNMVTHRTVIVIISDGWDRGDVSLLEREMRALRRRCYKIIWLNPLLASENYEPLCKGMQAALPYLDYFLSAHNAQSLFTVGRTLERLVA